MTKSIRFVCFLVGGLLFLNIYWSAWAGEFQPRRNETIPVAQPIQEKAEPQETTQTETPKKAKLPFVLPKKSTSKFIRIKEDQKGEPRSLQTSIVRYVPKEGNSGIVVDLVGVVHVAERDYYYDLNDKLAKYDAVLYELVAPEGKKIPRAGAKSDNPIAILQKVVTAFLMLDLQLDHVDYTRKNFVHADLSPKQMAEKMKQRGDDGLTIALGVIADILREQNKMMRNQKANPNLPELPADPLALLTDPKAPCKLKRLMASQLANMDNAAIGKTLNTILVEDRNSACMKVLNRELIKGKKKIAIFYGAAHMPDFEERLTRDLGFQKQSEEWIDAWDLRMRDVNMLELLNRFQP